MAANALAVHQPAALTVYRDADLYRLGALVLRRLDRASMITRIIRIVLYSQRVVAYHLSLPYRDACRYQLAEYLKARTGLSAQLLPTSKGCALLIDLTSVPITVSEPNVDPNLKGA